MRHAAATLGLLALGAGVVTFAAAPTDSTGGPYRNGLVAYVRCCGLPETGIFVIRPNGTGARKLFTPKGDDAPLDPSWSPDGREIAFVPGRPQGGVWVMRADGSGRHRITRGKGDSLFPGWSPDGRWVVFSDVGAGPRGSHDLYRVRANGTGLRRLTRTAADELVATWARGEIVYARRRDLWHMKPDGSEQRRFLRNATSPSWSLGGTHLSFVRGGDPWVAARDGSGAKRVAHLPRPQAAVTWSPDGRLLVTAPLDRGELTLVRADGSGTTPLTDEPGYAYSWPSWQRLPS